MIKQLSLSNITDNKDYKYALAEMLRYAHMVELDGYQKPDMAHVLLVSAISIMDYEDPWDARNLDQDKDRPRKIRLSNFWDYAEEQASKRLALREESDPYLENIIQQYQKTKTTVKMFDNLAQGGDKYERDIEKAFHFIEGCTDEIIVHGIARLGIARAILDIAFVYAYQSGAEIYKDFCQSVAAVFELENARFVQETTELVDESVDAMFENDDQQVPTQSAAQALMAMEPASHMIH